MNVYHFIKYNENTCLNKLIAEADEQTTICFDFEDSIQNCLIPERTSVLKARYRQYFKSILDNCRVDIRKANIGIRISAVNSPEHVNDIAALAGIRHIPVIFLPKVSNPVQVLMLQQELDKSGVSYREIIPVIETKEGLNNLHEITLVSPHTVRSIAFGHCDYNLDNNTYPFFHQNSREYWSWISKIAEYTIPAALSLINSPFLQLDNDEFFTKILAIHYSICGEKAGQITLTRNQTKICSSYSPEKNDDLPLLLNKLDLRVPASYLQNFIDSFEKDVNEKGFAINGHRRLLSPQEYTASLNYQRKADLPEINFTFAGGCFPVQGSVAFEDLFHQVLKRKMEMFNDVRFNVNIIRYEQFSNCIQKIEACNAENAIDILAFSIRPEPFLREVKLHHTIPDNLNGREPRFNPTAFTDASPISKTFRNLNYLSGFLLGNHYNSLRRYLKLVNEVIEFTKRKNIKLIIVGPPLRTNTLAEEYLSRRLDSFMRKSLAVSPNEYISGSDLFTDGEPLFRNGIYANERYHKLIGERIFKKISSETINIPLNNHIRI